MQEYNLYSVFSEYLRPPAGYSLRAQNSAVQQKLDHKETLNKKENNSPYSCFSPEEEKSNI